MRKMLCLYSILGITIMVLSGCATTSPNWVTIQGKQTTLEPSISNGDIIQGVGVSEDKANIRATRDTAYADALAKLAEQVKVKLEGETQVVMGNWKDYIKQNLETSIEEVKGLIKAIINVELQGPKPTQEYIDKKTKRYWVRMLLSSSTVEKWLKERLQAEQELNRLFIEAKSNQIKEELGKDINALKEAEKAEKEKITSILGGN